MSRKTKSFRARMAALAAGVLTVSFAGGIAGMAALAPAAHAESGNINPDAKGSITIHKFANPDLGKAGDGTELKDGEKPTTEPISDVTFTYAKVKNIDLSTNVGWTSAQSLTVDANGKITGKGPASPKTPESLVEMEFTTEEAVDFPATDKEGKATKAELPIGVYLVTEKSAPKNVTAKSAPFLVTIPSPNKAAQNGWLYDVHVYPKNTVLNPDDLPVKKVLDQDKVHFPGDEVAWQITQKVPALGTTEKLSTFKVIDDLPEGVNAVTEDKVTVEVLGTDNQKVDVTPQISIEASTNTVTVDFANVLDQLKSGYTVNVTIRATVADSLNGPLTNQSQTVINNETYKSSNPGKPGTEEPTTVDFSTLTIKKVNGQNLTLDGATFSIQPAVKDGSGPDEKFDPVEITTAEGGVATQKLAVGKYWVKEIKAPVGYEIDPQWATGKLVEVTANAEGNVQTITNLTAGDAGSKLPGLPLTGAQGALILAVVGVVLIGLGVWAGVASVRRRKAEQE